MFLSSATLAHGKTLLLVYYFVVVVVVFLLLLCPLLLLLLRLAHKDSSSNLGSHKQAGSPLLGDSVIHLGLNRRLSPIFFRPISVSKKTSTYTPLPLQSYPFLSSPPKTRWEFPKDALSADVIAVVELEWEDESTHTLFLSFSSSRS